MRQPSGLPTGRIPLLQSQHASVVIEKQEQSDEDHVLFGTPANFLPTKHELHNDNFSSSNLPHPMPIAQLPHPNDTFTSNEQTHLRSDPSVLNNTAPSSNHRGSRRTLVSVANSQRHTAFSATENAYLANTNPSSSIASSSPSISFSDESPNYSPFAPYASQDSSHRRESFLNARGIIKVVSEGIYARSPRSRVTTSNTTSISTRVAATSSPQKSFPSPKSQQSSHSRSSPVPHDVEQIVVIDPPEDQLHPTRIPISLLITPNTLTTVSPLAMVMPDHRNLFSPATDNKISKPVKDIEPPLVHKVEQSSQASKVSKPIAPIASSSQKSRSVKVSIPQTQPRPLRRLVPKETKLSEPQPQLTPTPTLAHRSRRYPTTESSVLSGLRSRSPLKVSQPLTQPTPALTLPEFVRSTSPPDIKPSPMKVSQPLTQPTPSRRPRPGRSRRSPAAEPRSSLNHATNLSSLDPVPELTADDSKSTIVTSGETKEVFAVESPVKKESSLPLLAKDSQLLSLRSPSQRIKSPSLKKLLAIQDALPSTVRSPVKVDRSAKTVSKRSARRLLYDHSMPVSSQPVPQKQTTQQDADLFSPSIIIRAQRSRFDGDEALVTMSSSSSFASLSTPQTASSILPSTPLLTEATPDASSSSSVLLPPATNNAEPLKAGTKRKPSTLEKSSNVQKKIVGSSKRIQQYLIDMIPAQQRPVVGTEASSSSSSSSPASASTLPLPTTELPTVILAGSFVWAKSEGKSWWPGRAVYNPITGKLHTLDKKNNKKIHVELFGRRNPRCWLPVEDVVPYSTLTVEQVKEMSSHDRKLLAREVALDEAIELLTAQMQQTTQPQKDEVQRVADKKDSQHGDGPPCYICESGNAQVLCHGGCDRSFHVSCLGLVNTPKGDFICDRCSQDIHQCLHCLSTGSTIVEGTGEVLECDQRECHQYFHADCALLYQAAEPRNTGSFSCPLHRCSKCKQTFGTNKGVVQCLRCPTAYHKQCTPVGSTMLGPQHMVCARHVERKVSKNYEYCVYCNEIGEVLCCDGCPTSAHPKCAGLKEAPKGKWICVECHTRPLPCYGDVVLVKFGQWRVWPVILLAEDDRPEWLQKRPHKPSDVPVRFLGCSQYQWVGLSLTMAYDESMLPRPKTDPTTVVEKQYKLGCEEAKKLNASGTILSGDNQPPPPSFTKLSRNQYIAPCKPKKHRFEVETCLCRPSDPCGHQCLNRALYIECDDSNCQMKTCTNRRLQNKQWAKVEMFYAGHKGWGLKAGQSLKKGDLIAEYTGEVINEITCAERLKFSKEHGIKHFYFITLDDDCIIDASVKGSVARLINHSCSPNCETLKWTVNGVVRIGIYALDDVEKGTELSFDYQFDTLLQQSQPCFCGAPNCSGFIGQKKKKPSQVVKAKGPSKPGFRRSVPNVPTTVRPSTKTSNKRRLISLTDKPEEVDPPKPKRRRIATDVVL